MKRIERDLLGEREIPQDALYGINSLRATENFPQMGDKFDPYFLKAYLLVKKASLQAAVEINALSHDKATPILEAIDHLLHNPQTFEQHIIVPTNQGGAGTSLHMNINEVIANQTLLLMGQQPGDYHIIHPLNHVNVCQSTNDTYPSALRIALIWRIRELTQSVCALQEALQAKEKEFAGIVKCGMTQMQYAVPVTLGAEFGAYAEAISRDRWRLYKSEERLRIINLGGTAIGTGLNAPRKYGFLAVQYLQALTGIGTAKAENLLEATSNQDLLLEVFGWIKVLASNLLKISNDLRYLSSSPVNEINLPKLQSGSTIMPGKINPVGVEMLTQAALEIYGAETIISHAVMMGHLELNPFLPLISRYFLKSLHLLNNTIDLFTTRTLTGITANTEQCYIHLLNSSSVLSALNPKLGYEQVSQLQKEAIEKGIDIRQLLIARNILSPQELEELLNLQRMLVQK